MCIGAKMSTTDSPLVSLVTVCYNSENTIEDTIISVINQSYKKIEYIIVDGKSSDRTIEIIKKYANEFPSLIKYISEADSGIYYAMNKGIELSSGSIIGIINSDDWYENDAVQQVVETFKTNKSSMVHADMFVWQNDKKIFKAKGQKNLAKLCKGMIINHPTVFLTRSAYNVYGLFNTKYRIAADWDLMLRLWLNNERITYLEAVISNFRLGGGSYDFSKEMIREKNMVRKQNKIYKYIDRYYIKDMIKYYLLPKSVVLKLAIIKTKIMNGTW
jgi:glycosyltransferase involved in cell wall biosynthesis